MLLFLFKTVFIVNFLIIIQISAEKQFLNDAVLHERQVYGKKIASYMNTKINPCDDFYEYACGNYFKVNKPKKGIRIQSVLLNIENQEIDDFQNMLMEPPEKANGKLSAADKIKYAYQSCINANIFQFKKSEAYLKAIESLGGWPALDSNWKPENFDWFHVMITLKQYGVDFLINEEVQSDQGDFISLKLEPFGLTELTKEDLNRTRSRNYIINKQLAMKIMKIYGISKKDAKKAYKEVLEYGELVALDEFAKLIEDLAAFTIEDLLSISNLTKQTEVYDWEKYFSTLAGKPVNVTQKILFVPALPLFKELPNVFKDKKIIRGAANYVALKLLFKLYNEFSSPQYPERFCFFHIQKYMSLIGSYLYSDSKYYSKANEQETWNILNYVRNTFKNSIMSHDWMDETSKRRTVAKVDNMEIFIGYLNQTWNSDEVEEEYKDLNINPDDFYENNLNLRRHYQKTLHKICVSEADKKQYLAPLLIDLNAFYNIFRNKLIIPAVLLVKPFVYPELPKSFNFANIGRIIGHEMIHGFDSVGKNLNENAQPEIWWSNDTMESYTVREECLEKEYSTFLVPELNETINGEDSIQENIADNGAIRQIYYAYKKWLNDNEHSIDVKNDETLPGLNLTNYQLFFLFYGQTFCTRYSNRKAYNLYIKGTYAVENYRLIGSLSNFDEFSKHFNCKVGSRMNPENKCILW